MEEQKNHPAFRVFFIPFFATGHILPFVDLAWQFAARGVDSTVLLTPANAALVRRTIDHAGRAGLPLRLLSYPFPAAEVGLPKGQENLSTVSPSDEHKIYHAVELSKTLHERILRELRPDAVVGDFWFPTAAADELGIPRVNFNVIGVFPQCVIHSLNKSRLHETFVDSEGDNSLFVVPDLPHPVEMVRSELPMLLRCPDDNAELLNRQHEIQLTAHGVVVNTFYELEQPYAELYRRTQCRRSWLVGPLSLFCRGDDDKGAVAAARGGDELSVSNVELCMAWLKTQDPASVVFVCFGSWNHFSDGQLHELALGLEASGVPFLWAVREEHWARADEWAPVGLEKRISGRGLVLKGWTPQAAILSHPSVGAFLTHCGWNSVTEGVAAGLPLITWPLVFEQFINEKLVVAVHRVGVRLYQGFRSSLPEEAARLVVDREAIVRVVSRFSRRIVDEEVEGMRSRVRVLAAAAKAATEEGGTSHMDLARLIEDLKSYRGGAGGEVDAPEKPA